MRKLLCDAVEALWVLLTAPLKKLVTDAVADALIREASRDALDRCPDLDTPQHDCSLLGTPPKWMMDVYAELGRDTP